MNRLSPLKLFVVCSLLMLSAGSAHAGIQRLDNCERVPGVGNAIFDPSFYKGLPITEYAGYRSIRAVLEEFGDELEREIARGVWVDPVPVDQRGPLTAFCADRHSAYHCMAALFKMDVLTGGRYAGTADQLFRLITDPTANNVQTEITLHDGESTPTARDAELVLGRGYMILLAISYEVWAIANGKTEQEARALRPLGDFAFDMFVGQDNLAPDPTIKEYGQPAKALRYMYYWALVTKRSKADIDYVKEKITELFSQSHPELRVGDNLRDGRDLENDPSLTTFTIDGEGFTPRYALNGDLIFEASFLSNADLADYFARNPLNYISGIDATDSLLHPFCPSNFSDFDQSRVAGHHWDKLPFFYQHLTFPAPSPMSQQERDIRRAIRVFLDHGMRMHEAFKRDEKNYWLYSHWVPSTAITALLPVRLDFKRLDGKEFGAVLDTNLLEELGFYE